MRVIGFPEVMGWTEDLQRSLLSNVSVIVNAAMKLELGIIVDT